VVFKPLDIPQTAEFCGLWRDLARRAGLPGLHLVGFGKPGWDPRHHGFDASVLHGPKLPWPRLGRSLRKRLLPRLRVPSVFSYKAFVRRGFPDVASPRNYPVAIPNWDNTPRVGRRGSILHGSTPELFRLHLREALGRVAAQPPENRIVFLKSWNEWAEGNYLEPDHRFGHGFLRVVGEEARRAEAQWRRDERDAEPARVAAQPRA
jgi:hypothetical protein